jgi:hypothetical protein
MPTLLMVMAIVISPFSLYFANNLADPYLNKKDAFSFIKVALILLLIALGIPVSLLMFSLYSLQ